MRRRVLQVFNQYRERGGEEKSALRIFEHAQDVCEIDRLWWDSRDWDSKDGPGALGQLRRLFYNPDAAAELRAKIREFRPDVLLCHNLYPIGSPAVYHVAQSEGIPVIQYAHNFRPFSVGGSLWANDQPALGSLQGHYWREVVDGSWQNSLLKSALFAIVLKRLHSSGWLSSVKTWVCISEFMQKQFIAAGLNEEEVVALKHAWDPRSDEPSGVDQGHYVFLSRLVPEKGVSVLLEAWQLLEAELGEKTPKLVIGGVGSEEDAVRSSANQSQYIEYRGFVDHESKVELLTSCRAMLAPSVWWEPLGLVTYEAYDYGKPMLAAASGGLTETVKNGETGILFEPSNAGALAKAVRELEGLSGDERIAMGTRGRDWLVDEFSPNLWKKRFEQVLESALTKI